MAGVLPGTTPIMAAGASITVTGMDSTMAIGTVTTRAIGTGTMPVCTTVPSTPITSIAWTTIAIIMDREVEALLQGMSLAAEMLARFMEEA